MHFVLARSLHHQKCVILPRGTMKIYLSIQHFCVLITVIIVDAVMILRWILLEVGYRKNCGNMRIRLALN